MYDPSRRTQALAALADAMEADAERLVEALVADLQIAAKAVRTVELPSAVAAFRQFRDDRAFPFHPSLRTGERVPQGAVGILAPRECLLSVLGRALAAAFLAGNDQILLSMHPDAHRTDAVLRPMLEAHIPGIMIFLEDRDVFLERCLFDPYLSTLYCATDAEWMLQHRETVRETRTRVVFEGHGNDSFIVCEDADLLKAVPDAAQAAFHHAGQDPASAQRFYVHISQYRSFVGQLAQAARGLVVGAASAGDTDVGPMMREECLSRLKEQLADARARGAIVRGGARFRRVEGNRLPSLTPTVLARCNANMKIVSEPCPGPVAAIIPYKTVDELLAQALGARNGFTASVYGGNNDLWRHLTRRFGHVTRNATVFSPGNGNARYDWGGYGRTSWVWEWSQSEFTRRPGPQQLVIEFSRYDDPFTSIPPKDHEAA